VRDEIALNKKGEAHDSFIAFEKQIYHDETIMCFAHKLA